MADPLPPARRAAFASVSAVLVLLLLLSSASLQLFLSGFLLSRSALPVTTTCSSSELSCTLPPTHSKLVFLVVDALRADFVFPVQEAEHPSPFYSNQLTYPSELASKDPSRALLLHGVADAPTTTLQRIKGLTTGSLPTFVDAGSNFGSSAVGEEDSWLWQAHKAGKRIGLIGDETWLSVFPRAGLNESVWTEGLTWPFDSFNVEDLDTVDNGVRSHLLPLLESSRDMEWDVLVAHMLGLDHAGHRFGATHSETTRKLREADSLIWEIVDKLEDDTLLVVLGDHGMTDHGDHGGDSREEVDAALFLYSKVPVFAGLPRELVTAFKPAREDEAEFADQSYAGSSSQRVVSQIDLVPTLSLLLGLPLPYGNLGLPIPEAFFRSLPSASLPTAESTLLQAYVIVSSQIETYLATYTSLSTGKDLLPHMPELTFALGIAQSTYKSSFDPTRGAQNRAGQATEALRRLRDYGVRVRERARATWARFDPLLILLGLVAWVGAIAVGGVQLQTPPTLAAARELVVIAVEGAGLGLAVAMAARSAGALAAIVNGRGSEWAVVIGIALFGAEAAIVTTHFSHSATKRAFKKRENWLGVLILVAHAAMLASNSFTVFEDRALLFLAASCIIVSLVRAFSAPEERLRNQAIGYSAAALVAVRAMASSTICREEQIPRCVATFHLAPGSPAALAVAVLATLLTTWVVPEGLRYLLHKSRSDEGFAPLYLGIVLRGLALASGGYWLLDWVVAAAPEWAVVGTLAKTGLARVVLVAVPLLCGVVWPLMPLNIRIERRQVGAKTQVQVIGFANALGGYYMLFFGTAFALLALVNSPVGQLVLVLQLVAILSLLELFDAERDIDFLQNIFSTAAGLEAMLNAEGELGMPTAPPHTGPSMYQIALLSLVSQLAFFATGHQAVLSTIQWSTAFIGFPQLVYPFGPALVVLNTMSSHILTALALPLFVFWNVPPSLDGAKPLPMLSSLLKAEVKFISYQAVVSLAAAGFAGYLRRHLMVWKVFAPRFMLGGLTMLVVDVACLLAVAWGARTTIRKAQRTLGAQFI